MNLPETVSAGFYLQYLRSLRDQIKGLFGFDVYEEARTLSTFHVTEIRRPYARQIDSGATWANIVGVYTDMLCRGLPTLPSEFLERTLLEKCIERNLASEHTDKRAGSIEFSLPERDRALTPRWLEMLARAHIAIDARLRPSDFDVELFGSSEERDFYRQSLAGALGNGLCQLVEPQSSFRTLLPTSLSENYVAQMVDFAVSGPDWKLILEIDGGQHQEIAHAAGDARRDNALRANNWNVVRIAASDCLSSSTKDKLRQAVPDSNYTRFATLNYEKPLWNNQDEQLALQVVLASFAVARVQFCLLRAMAQGILSPTETHWKLAIVEWDVRAGVLALVDFVEHLRAFSNLHKLDWKPPEIDILVYYTPEFADCSVEIPDHKLRSLRIRTRSMELGTTRERFEAVDVLIDLAVLARNGYRRYSSELVDRHLATTGVAYEIRSAYHFADRRHISPLMPIPYSIEPVSITTGNSRQRQDVDEISRDSLTFFLRNIYRKLEFRDGQLPIIGRALRLEPVIGLLPTGAGKSLCYQLAALLQPGMTIVIDPLVSLMVDQVDNLLCGPSIDWIGEISSLRDAAKKAETSAAMSNGKVKILFISPERLQSRAFRETLQEFSMAYPVSYAVLDEAHCVSEWGHDFRTSYLRVAKTLRQYCRRFDLEPSLIALTGTASFAVLSDVQRELDVDDDNAQVYPNSFDRDELRYRVVNAPSSQKQQQLLRLLFNQLPEEFSTAWPDLYRQAGTETRAGIIFTPHVKGYFGAQNLSTTLFGKLNVPVKCFTGRTEGSQKETTQREFKNNQFAVLVATKAFGMGIDKPNVRYTIHYNIPPSLEAFYQEAGRAGRDRQNATCWLLFSDDSPEEADEALASDADEVTVGQIADRRGGDVHRLLWLHRNSFRGLDRELEEIKDIYRRYIGLALKGLPTESAVDLVIPFSDAEADNGMQMRRDKALYRLAILGIVEDYTLDYGKKVFEVTALALSDGQLVYNLQRYISRYKTSDVVDAVPARLQNESGRTLLGKCSAYLLRFVYEEIEKKRRAAIRSMAEVARKTASISDYREQDRYLRGELTAYLEKSPFTDALQALAGTIDPAQWLDILQLEDINGVRLLSTIDGVRLLIGGCRRTMESYPDHPGLFFLSAVGRLLLPDPDVDQAMNESRQAFRRVAAFEQRLRDVAINTMLRGYRSSLTSVQNGDRLYRQAAAVALSENPIRSLARDLYTVIPSDSRQVIYNLILTDIRSLNNRLAQ